MTQSNISLKPYNTFGIDVSCDHFSTFASIAELKVLLKQYQDKKRLILGGGSNMLFTKDFYGAVLKNEIKGIAVSAETDDTIDLTVGAGEVWHDFVLYCVDHNFGGVENLSLIPGTVGASPMQNIGAYGVEIKDIFVRLEAVEIASGEVRTFTNEECHFGYRESIFKNT
ncbi:MAG: FAD-binding protein, partial [Bacteroidetes bacterium]